MGRPNFQLVVIHKVGHVGALVLGTHVYWISDFLSSCKAPSWTGGLTHRQMFGPKT